MQAFQLPTPAGPRFAILHEPTGRAAGAVLLVPPFAEEMNKCRRIAALQARAFAAAGFAVLSVDLLGTGDSPGDFGDATWAAWVADLHAARDWLRARIDAPLWLWGVRAGCLLASALEGNEARVYWQPVLSGRLYLQQFLRISVVRERTGEATEGASNVRALRAALAAGESLEVAGYTITPALAQALEAAELGAAPARTLWFEVSPAETPQLLPVSVQRIEAWRAQGCTIEAAAIQGLQFWQTQEITVCDELVRRTTEAVGAATRSPR